MTKISSYLLPASKKKSEKFLDLLPVHQNVMDLMLEMHVYQEVEDTYGQEYD